MAGYQNVAQRNLSCAIRIKERRRELGLTQAEVVERVAGYGSRLSNQALSAIENGRRLAVGRLPDLAGALDCTVTYLIGLTADPHRWQPDLPQPRQQLTAASPEAPDPSENTAPQGTPGAPASSHRSWILGPDVPDISAELRSRAPRPHPSESRP